jgi:hypothetical protein
MARYYASGHLGPGDDKPTPLQLRIDLAVTNGLGYEPVPHGNHRKDRLNLQDHLHMLDQNTGKDHFYARIRQLIKRSTGNDHNDQAREKRLRIIRVLNLHISPQDG